MSGLTALVDTLLATRLAQRVDLVPLKPEVEIAGPGPVTQVEEVGNDVRLASRAAVEQQLGVGLLKSDQRGHGGAPASAGEAVTLSVAARAVSAILEGQTEATARIVGAEPLLPKTQPPLPHQLAATLARTVAHSGLFYESHLAQYAAGARTLAELALEPQARFDAMAKVALALPGAATAPQETGPAALPDTGKHAAAASVPTSGPGALATGLDSGPLMHNIDPDHLHKTAYASIQEADGQAPALKTHGAADAARAIAPGQAGIHPDALTLVRQQLELLALPVFRWGGEAWPGVPMEWEIRKEPQDGQPELPERQATADSEAAPRTWSTRVALTLPTLKEVELRISLVGTLLQVHLAAREDATLEVLDGGRAELPGRLEALGLQLTGLQISSLSAASAARALPKDDDAH